jgi:1,2-diacylglycerol 3-alpha-glucosyltransferase
MYCNLRREKDESCQWGGPWWIIDGKGVEPMRIAMFSDSYYPYVSGVTRAVATMKDTLLSLGHEVVVFCPNYPDAKPEIGVIRLASVKAPTYAGYYVAIPFFPTVIRQVRRFSPDVIHVHSPFNLGMMGLWAGRQQNVPVALTYHTMYNMYSHYFPLIGQSVSRAVERTAFKAARKADAVITPSGAIARYLAERGATSKAIPIPNGIPIAEFQGGNPRYLHDYHGIPAGTPIVLTCGRLGKEKNLEVLLASFAKVTQRINANLVLVGDGPLRDVLKEEAESLGIRDRTHFIGIVPPDMMTHVYAGASLFMFTSLTDTQGLVLVEAKAAGLPAVAVGALGVVDMVQDGIDGFLCPNDPDEISRKTVSLLENPALLAQMSDNARRTAQEFSREKCAQRLLECYRSIIRT